MLLSRAKHFQGGNGKVFERFQGFLLWVDGVTKTTILGKKV